MPRVLIEDGYTLTAKTEPRGRLPEVKFSYRPALARRVMKYESALALGNTYPEAFTDELIGLVAEHVTSWDVEGKDGTAKIDKDTVAKVPDPILFQMAKTITGFLAELAVDEKKSPGPSLAG